MDVLGLLEDDGAERVVGEVELGDVDVDELEPGRGQPLESPPRREPARPDVQSGSSSWRRRTPTRSPLHRVAGRIARPASTPRSVAVCSTVRVSVPT